MKTVFALALMIVSIAVSAQELDATAALAQVLPGGHYAGITPEGADCAVSIVRTRDGVSTSATSQGMTLSRTVANGSFYRWNPGTRYFLSSDTTYSRDGINSVEEVFRTLAVDTLTQYVVVARVIVDNRNVKEDKIECVVNLN